MLTISSAELPFSAPLGFNDVRKINVILFAHKDWREAMAPAHVILFATAYREHLHPKSARFATLIGHFFSPSSVQTVDGSTLWIIAYSR